MTKIFVFKATPSNEDPTSRPMDGVEYTYTTPPPEKMIVEYTTPPRIIYKANSKFQRKEFKIKSSVRRSLLEEFESVL